MSDDKNRRGPEDRRTVSSQPYEIGYEISRAAKEHPNIPRENVAKAVFSARKEIQPSESRAKFREALQRRLK
jgi:hypothetical protein